MTFFMINDKINSMHKSKGFVQAIALVPLLGLVAMAFVVGILWQKVQSLEKGGTTTTTQGTTATPAPAVQVSLAQIKELFGKDVIKIGDANRKIIFTEIADPSCPYCSIASGQNSELNNQQPQFKMVKDGGTYLPPVPEMKKLVDQGQASFIYIYFPGHGAGEMGAKALYCAHEKGKFWPVHDALMTNKGYELINNTVKNDKAQAGALATFLGSAFPEADMKTCLESGKYDQRLADDIVIARNLGVQGTPGFFVNETPYSGAYSYKDMQSTVDAALKS